MEFGKLGVELLNQKKVALWEFHQELKEHPTMNVPLCNSYMVWVLIFVEDDNFEHGPGGSHQGELPLR